MARKPKKLELTLESVQAHFDYLDAELARMRVCLEELQAIQGAQQLREDQRKRARRWTDP